jgi:acyl-CoA synthetase (AMP-forming)/AMP-acid ligase II
LAQSHPEKLAYVMAGSGRGVTYRELNDASNRAAQLLRAIGLRSGDGIALCMENNVHYFPVCWAAQRSGLRYTAISSRLTAPEVEYIVKDCGARVYVTSHALRDVAHDLVSALGPPVARYMVDGTVAGYESWEARTAAQPAEPVPDEEEGVDMLYSSGTTGRPKGIKTPLPGKALGNPPPLTRLITAMYGVTADSVYLSPAPLYHAAPLRFNISMQRIGATSIVMEHFDALESLRLIERYRVTHSQWVPTMFVRLLKLPEEERKRFDLSSHRLALHAAAPCPIPVKERMIEWWGPIIHEYYAGTEGNGFAACNSTEWLAHKGTVGRALTGEIHIVDDDGNELPTGETGTVYFAGGARFEYHNDPEKTAASFDRRGWSTLGDVGHLDEDGYLYLTDRKAYMIISGGVNIYPQEAENVLVTHPKVKDVAVIGVPNEEFGEEVKAVVEPVDMAAAGPELEQELIAYCQAHLSKLKCPRSIDFERELPRHPTGKLYKRLLKDRYWGRHESRII